MGPLSALLLLLAASRCSQAADTQRRTQEVTSPGGCPVGNTVCAGGCCPNELKGAGVCCGDGLHCCAHGYRCGSGECVAHNVSAHPLAKTTNLYRLCTGPPPLQFFKERLTGLRFPYYESTVPANDIKLAVVVVHGAGRNADDYYCAVDAAATLQQAGWDRQSIGLFAPRFWEPQDDPASGSIFWNGSDPNGVWRFGANSSSVGGGTTASSFAVLDQLLARILDRRRYPAVEQLTLVGHSSGGQLVQRYALTTQAADVGSDPRLRFVVANPSSFAYLSPERWVDQGKPTERLALPPLAVRDESCRRYNRWEWGLQPGGETAPYVTGLVSTAARQRYITAYSQRDVRYLIGGADVCNEAMTPGCLSHGLETTCMDMLQGYNRRFRAEHYIKHLLAVYLNFNNLLLLHAQYCNRLI